MKRLKFYQHKTVIETINTIILCIFSLAVPPIDGNPLSSKKIICGYKVVPVRNDSYVTKFNQSSEVT